VNRLACTAVSGRIASEPALSLDTRPEIATLEASAKVLGLIEHPPYY
jgi:hypothetical protein